MGEITLGMMLFLVGLVSDDKLINNIMGENKLHFLIG